MVLLNGSGTILLRTISFSNLVCLLLERKCIRSDQSLTSSSSRREVFHKRSNNDCKQNQSIYNGFIPYHSNLSSHYLEADDWMLQSYNFQSLAGSIKSRPLSRFDKQETPLVNPEVVNPSLLSFGQEMWNPENELPKVSTSSSSTYSMSATRFNFPSS
ncbi:hypothetical protein NE237_028858 [Protea cynaroides]|uniref:Uncharacterized protein n=1 Tax=Protea cynaroides TaxID=273540 RepID=A0A9Q0GQ49_9MAGN|nr:hypothetical protein NE237_028858 [Protea cynaroides]